LVLTFATHDEPNRPHRRIHPNKKQGEIKKLKTSRPLDGIGYTSPVKKLRSTSARFDKLEELSSFRIKKS